MNNVCILLLVILILVWLIYRHNKNNLKPLEANNTGGFFWNCTIVLSSIIEYANEKRKFPITIDTTTGFTIYRGADYQKTDMLLEFFLDPKTLPDLPYIEGVDFNLHWAPHYNTERLQNQLHLLKPIIDKFFSPRPHILNMATLYINKYNLDLSNTCVVFYRGGMMHIEGDPMEYEQVLKKTKSVTNKGVRYFIQSDETAFITYMVKNLPNSFFFQENESTTNKRDLHHINTNTHNFKYMMNYMLPVVLIMSRCKYIVMGSRGNISMWPILYRASLNNVFLSDSTKIVDPTTKPPKRHHLEHFILQ